MNHILKTTCIIFFMLFGSGVLLAQDAKEIIRKSDERARGEANSIAEIKMTIVRPTWTRELSMKSWQQGQDYAMILIKSPARDKGIVYLKREREVWNWLPNIGRNVKLPPSMMSQSWMNSDFTNDDLVKEFSIIHDYTHEIVTDTVIEERTCWKIKLTPKPDAAVVWDKVYMWISQKEYLQLRTETYDEDGYLVNTMQASNIKKMDDRLIPTRLEMIPADEEGHKTVLEYESMEFDTKIPGNFFTTQNMKRLR